MLPPMPGHCYVPRSFLGSKPCSCDTPFLAREEDDGEEKAIIICVSKKPSISEDDMASPHQRRSSGSYIVLCVTFEARAELDGELYC